MISQGDSPDQGAAVPVSLQSSIEQERRDCRSLLLVTLVCMGCVLLAGAMMLRRCDRRQQIDLEQIKERWRQESGNTNFDERGVAGPLPPYLERLSTNK